MKLLAFVFTASAAAALVGCSGHGHDGQFDTNGAEMSVFPGDEGRTPAETNGQAAARVGKEVYQFRPDKPAVAHATPADTTKNNETPMTASKKQTPLPAETEVVETPVTSQQTEAIDTSYYETTTASSVEAGPKTKKELRKEKREARKAKKNN